MAVNTTNTDCLLQTIKWWEKKRIWFNLLVGLSGVISMYTFNTNLSLLGCTDFVGIIIWGILANILYSTGIILETTNLYYFKSKIKLYKLRHLFWTVGTIAYCLWTTVYSFFYYSNIAEW